jgi:phosphoglycolate phosphatase-like HAD superfamily hydrolase
MGFEGIFLPFGADIGNRVRRHHESNGGMSRFDKIPLYLAWAGEAATPTQVEDYCRKFSKSVCQAVIDSPWVPGVQEYLLQHSMDQYFVLVTATPQNEIEQIIAALNIEKCFREVYGAPSEKTCIIASVLKKLKIGLIWLQEIVPNK